MCAWSACKKRVDDCIRAGGKMSWVCCTFVRGTLGEGERMNASGLAERCHGCWRWGWVCCAVVFGCVRPLAYPRLNGPFPAFVPTPLPRHGPMLSVRASGRAPARCVASSCRPPRLNDPPHHTHTSLSCYIIPPLPIRRAFGIHVVSCMRQSSPVPAHTSKLCTTLGLSVAENMPRICAFSSCSGLRCVTQVSRDNKYCVQHSETTGRLLRKRRRTGSETPVDEGQPELTEQVMRRRILTLEASNDELMNHVDQLVKANKKLRARLARPRVCTDKASDSSSDDRPLELELAADKLAAPPPAAPTQTKTVVDGQPAPEPPTQAVRSEATTPPGSEAGGRATPAQRADSGADGPTRFVRLRDVVHSFDSNRCDGVEREDWPHGKVDRADIPGLDAYLEGNVHSAASRNQCRLAIDRVFWCLEHDYAPNAVTELVLDAAKGRVWTQMFATKLWAKEKQWTTTAALSMSHLLAFLQSEAGLDDNEKLHARLDMVNKECFVKVRAACHPYRTVREGERFKRDQRKIENFCSVHEMQCGLRRAMWDLKVLDAKEGDWTQLDHEHMLAIVTGVIFTGAIGDRAGDWEQLSRSDVQDRIQRRDPTTGEPQEPDDFLVCDKHKNRKRGKFFIAKYLSPAHVTVLLIVLKRARRPLANQLLLQGWDTEHRYSAQTYMKAYHRRYLPKTRTTVTTQLMRKFFETNVPTDNKQLVKKVLANALNHGQQLASKVYNLKGCRAMAQEAKLLYLAVFTRFVEWGEEPQKELTWYDSSEGGVEPTPPQPAEGGAHEATDPVCEVDSETDSCADDLERELADILAEAERSSQADAGSQPSQRSSQEDAGSQPSHHSSQADAESQPSQGPTSPAAACSVSSSRACTPRNPTQAEMFERVERVVALTKSPGTSSSKSGSPTVASPAAAAGVSDAVGETQVKSEPSDSEPAVRRRSLGELMGISARQVGVITLLDDHIHTDTTTQTKLTLTRTRKRGSCVFSPAQLEWLEERYRTSKVDGMPSGKWLQAAYKSGRNLRPNDPSRLPKLERDGVRQIRQALRTYLQYSSPESSRGPLAA